MKNVAKISFLLLSTKLKRTLSFLCLFALLSVTAGLIGNSFIKKDATPPVHIAVVDLEQSEQTKLLYSTLLSSLRDDSLLQVEAMSEQAASQALREGRVSAVFVIPEGFIQSILEGGNMPFQASYNLYTPLQSGLIKVLVDQVLTILKTSQSGIYATLDYTSEQAPQQYSSMYLAINARYMSAALQHNQVMDATVVSSTGRVGIFTYYLLSFLVFLLTLGCCLFTPLLNARFSSVVLASLRRQNTKETSIVGGWIIGWWGWYGLVGILLSIAYALFSVLNNQGLPFLLLPALLLFLLYLSSFGVFISFVIPNSTKGISVISLYGLASLFFSGGIIPLNYLPSFFSKTALFFPSYWGVRLLESAVLGKFSWLSCVILLLFSFVFFIATTSSLNIRQKEVRG